jgi:hypothetical protein
MRLPSAALVAAAVLTLSAPALAQNYAQPPGGGVYTRYRADDDYDGGYCDSSGWRRGALSPVRIHVGGAVRGDEHSATPGLLTAIDFFRGPAGMRLSAMWFHVGSSQGLAQYTGEMTLDLGGRSPWRPVIGAGAGYARTWRVDDAGNRVSGGANLGIGLMRVALEYRLPIEGTDSRVGLGVTGVLPAIKSSDAPDLKGWVIAGLSVGIGF